jgi:hypothetical protein
VSQWKILGWLVFFAAPALAQQTVFNVPSADVLERGKVYSELDATIHPDRFAFGAVPRIVVGIGKGMEVGLNVSGFTAPQSSDVAVSPAFKYRIFQSRGWSVLLGDTLTLSPEANHPVGNYVYGMVARTFSSGTRIAAGPYHFSPGVVARTQYACAQMSIEQTVSKRTSLAADWISGNNSSGYFTPGLIWKASKQLTVYSSYEIGNHGLRSGNHGFEFELGWNFN